MQDLREQIQPQPLVNEMRTSYLDYAMSVIVARALPDVRDGLKPVHRRILYAMFREGLVPGRPYSKCAGVVGEVLKKYHPHGDSAVYDSLVRMAQPWAMRHVLIDGQGNFGSIDGDPPAAYRYTECRLDRIADHLLADIDKDTVNFSPNFDGKTTEPDVLPAAFPNLLVNGSAGIAVGMATNIPPHNLGEVIDALVLLIDKPDSSLADIMKVLPGPDFPTGGQICGRTGIHDAYRTGRGRLRLRARAQMEEMKKGKTAIVITEIPFQVNKTRLLEEIAKLVNDRRLTEIGDVRDESDRDGMRIVMELKRDEVAQVVLNKLFKHTQLETTFGVINLALVNGRPRYLSLPKMLYLYLEHRRDVVVRRTRFDLDKAEKRAHVLEGLRVALEHIDAIIELIKKAKDRGAARDGLMKRYELSEVQAISILEMQLQRLTGLEREKIESEYRDVIKLIKELRAVLADPRRVMALIRAELLEIKEKHATPRRTEIVGDAQDLSIEDLIAEENMVITVSHAGYIKRTPTSTYRRQRRGGRGVTGMETKEEDWVEHLFVGTTHNYILFFTSLGRAHWLKVHELPQAGRASKGRPIVNMLELQPDERVCAMIPVRQFAEDQFIVMVTKMGQIVRNSLGLYSNPRRAGINAIKIDAGDELVEVRLTNGRQQIVVGTKSGMAIRFDEDQVRAMGRHVGGVKAISLRKGDEVVGMEVVRPGAWLLTVCENGYGKRTALDEYPVQSRGGLGVITIKTSPRNGDVISICEVIEGDGLIMITQHGLTIRTNIDEIRPISRATQGVRIINLEEGDKLIGVARIVEPEAPGEEGDDVDDEAEEGPEQTTLLPE
ncbi:MAG: DNA gyrase subunit A [Candidatus Sumerlaeia bacterium]|nr:DNA gyrase subunit A [Candidatus Sumerlaeia bacterium]